MTPSAADRIDAAWLADPRLQNILSVVDGVGDQTRVVGGAVRNTLLGIPVGDIDLATTAPPNVIMTRCEEAGLRVIPTGIDHGTVTIVHEGLVVEATTLREDVETDGRHAEVAPTRDWHADAARRDFTINALYCNGDGEVFDPVGGLTDIATPRVRFVGDPDTRIEEDYLRVLRYFRFHSQLGIEIRHDQDFAACVRAMPGLARLSAERVSSEFLKMLGTSAPEIGVRGMLDAGLLPRVLGGVPRVTLMERVFEQMDGRKDAILLLGALAVHVSENADQLQSRLRLSGADSARLRAMGEPLVAADLADSASIRRQLYLCGATAFGDRLMIALGRELLSVEQKELALAVMQTWKKPMLPVGGADVIALGVPAGPRVGDLLDKVRLAWIDSDFTMSETAAKEQLARLAEQEKRDE